MKKLVLTIQWRGTSGSLETEERHEYDSASDLLALAAAALLFEKCMAIRIDKEE